MELVSTSDVVVMPRSERSREAAATARPGATTLLARIRRVLARAPSRPPNDPQDTSLTEVEIALLK